MSSIMILGAGPLQVPIIEKAKNRGLYVYALDYNPDAVGMAMADTAIVVSTIDKEEVLKQVVKFSPDYVITSTSDMPVRTVAYVREKMGMPLDVSYQDAICATDKSFMRRRLAECNVPIPKFFVVNNEEEYLEAVNSFADTFVVKPADNAASRGVCLGNKSSEDILEFYRYSKESSRSGAVLVEEYMEGKEVSVESFTCDKETTIITITDKIITGPPHFVETGHSEPSMLPLETQEKIKEITLAAINAINVINGPTHTEVCVTKEGPKIVEIAARLGGDFITSKLVPLSTGVDMIENSLNSVLNEELSLNKTRNNGSAIRFISTQPGRISDISGIEEAKKIPGVVEVELYKNVGDVVGDIESSNDRVGHVVAVGDSSEVACEILDKAFSLINVKYN